MLVLHIVLTLVVILLFVGVLAYFLNRLARTLNQIGATLAKVSFGVRAVETQCAVIGPAADRINENLAEAAAGLGQAAELAERMGR
ncbi:MAG: hypothetical protein M3063_08715 [Actinomycetota bacterium]|nr:hypothetical protein [Actinomycetota bacterium]